MEGSEKTVDAQLVLIAAGFLGSQKYVTDEFAVSLDARTNVKTAAGEYETSVPGVFAAGDMHRGQSLVVWAIREGREAARAVGQISDGIYEYLRCNSSAFRLHCHTVTNNLSGLDIGNAGCYNTRQDKGVLISGQMPGISMPFFVPDSNRRYQISLWPFGQDRRKIWRISAKRKIYRWWRRKMWNFIRLQFTDMFGALKNIAIPSSQLMRAMDNGYMIDASSVEGVLRSREMELYLHPDLSTFTILPWRPQQGKVPDSCVIFTRRTGSLTRKAPAPF